MHPINKLLDKKNIRCPRCDVVLCFYCATESIHSKHLNDNPEEA